VNVPKRRLIREEVHPPRADNLHPRTRQSLFGVIQHVLHDLLLPGTARDERDAVSVVQDGVGEGDSGRRGLGRVGEVGYPAVLFEEERVTGEEGAGVAVGSVQTASVSLFITSREGKREKDAPNTEKNQIKPRERNARTSNETRHKLLLVVVGNLLRVIELARVDDVNRLTGDGDLGEEFLVVEAEVGIFVVEGDDAFVGEEDFPVCRRRKRRFSRPFLARVAVVGEGGIALPPLPAKSPPETGLESFSTALQDDGGMKRSSSASALFCSLLEERQTRRTGAHHPPFPPPHPRINHRRFASRELADACPCAAIPPVSSNAPHFWRAKLPDAIRLPLVKSAHLALLQGSLES
jgi:hypothetical protein